jgi:hypothetical protein
MQVEITAEIVGAVCTAGLGLFVGAFQEDITNLLHFAASRRNDYLRGEWNCTWITSQAPKPRDPIQDRVNLTLVRGNLVRGKGTTADYGDWEMEGRVADLAVSFAYAGRDQQRNLPGAIVLKKVSNDEMAGAWAQYALSGDVISGTTTWRRA